MSHQPIIDKPHGITDQEIKSIRRSTKGRVLYNAATNMAYQSQFNVGDILVVRKSDGKFVNLHDNIHQKWMVVHKDEANLIYAKKILAGGKLGNQVEMLATYDSSMRFELDPEKVESILVDQEGSYDPYQQAKDLKRRKDKQRRLNKEIKLVFEDFKKAEEFVSNLKPGDKIYKSYTLTENRYEEFEVISVEHKNLETSQWGHSADDQYRQAGFATKAVAKCKNLSRQQSWSPELSSRELSNKYCNYYTQPPHKTDDVR